LRDNTNLEHELYNLFITDYNTRTYRDLSSVQIVQAEEKAY